MQLYYYHKEPNFGDALNKIIWPHFIKIPLNDPTIENEYFVGIGTLLNDNLPKASKLHIFGSGSGYGSGNIPTTSNWCTHFVRGPLTAKKFGLDPALAITDPAILLHRMIEPERIKDIECAFVPHIGIDSPRLRSLCESVGLTYISPAEPVDRFLEKLNRSRKVIASAMHGAIAADALRIPWLPIKTSSEIYEFKWRDWTASLSIDITMRAIPTIWPNISDKPSAQAVAWIKAGIAKQKLEALSKSKQFYLSGENIFYAKLALIENEIDLFNIEHSPRN